MKKGDIVKIKKTGRIGMITWKRNNQEIGVNVGHYQIIKATRGTCSLSNLAGLGFDALFSKEELEAVAAGAG